MDAKTNVGRSFFSVVAWYAVFASLAALACYGVGWRNNIPDLRYYSSPDYADNAASLLAITAFFASVASLFGIRRHGWRVIVWKALVGLLFSCLVFRGLFILAMSEMAQVSRQ
jgi:hypothetical protein